MDQKALQNCGDEYGLRVTSPSSAPPDTDLKAEPIPGEMSQTLAGVGDSMFSPDGNGSLSSHSSAGDDSSDCSDALSNSTSLSSHSVHPLVFSSLPINTQQLRKAPVKLKPSVRHHRHPSRVGTWPLIPSATTQTLPRKQGYLLFDNASDMMAHAKRISKPGDDHTPTNSLPLRQATWSDSHSSPLYRRSPLGAQGLSLLRTEVLSDGSPQPGQDRIPGSIYLPVLTDGPTLDIEDKVVIASENAIPNTLEILGCRSVFVRHSVREF